MTPERGACNVSNINVIKDLSWCSASSCGVSRSALKVLSGGPFLQARELGDALSLEQVPAAQENTRW